MESYYSTKNKGRIGANLINAAKSLLSKLRSAHTGHASHDEKEEITALQDKIKRLEKRDQELRWEAERIATDMAKLTWKINRNTRPDDEVRKELAGIAKKIGELL
jgi:uncharacterized coiled-coil DUF342 family protein